MRIISKIHDFYDGVMATDQERDFCYHRIQREICLSGDQLDGAGASGRFPIFDSVITFYYPKSKPFNFEKINFKILGFCGELIPVMYYTNSAGIDETRIGLDAIFATADTEFKKCKIWFGNNFKEVFEKRIGKMLTNKKLQSIFYEYKVPVFIYGENNIYNRGATRLELNPSLKDIGFQKYADAYQTYQRIRQFVENDIAIIDVKKMPKLSDINMLESKGFDKRISFRKEKQQ